MVSHLIRALEMPLETLRMISERCIEMKNDIYICFIDYVKAFDKVKLEVLFQQLEQLDINGKDLVLLKNLYWEQKAAVRYGENIGNWAHIKSGVRQGCVLSPELLSLDTEMIMRKAQHLVGVKIGGINYNNLRYADDTAILAESEEQLQEIMDVVVKEQDSWSRNKSKEVLHHGSIKEKGNTSLQHPNRRKYP